MDTQQAVMFAISQEVAEIINAASELTVEEVTEWAGYAAQLKSNHDAATSIIDPTAWMRDRKGVDATAAVAQAFLGFRRAIDEALA